LSHVCVQWWWITIKVQPNLQVLLVDERWPLGQKRPHQNFRVARPFSRPMNCWLERMRSSRPTNNNVTVCFREIRNSARLPEKTFPWNCPEMFIIIGKKSCANKLWKNSAGYSSVNFRKLFLIDKFRFSLFVRKDK
jgi:hypothetical protein